MGYCSFFSKVESQYSKLYCDRKGLGGSTQGHVGEHSGTPRHGSAGRDTTGLHTGLAVHARRWPGHGVHRDTIFVSRQRGCDIARSARDREVGHDTIFLYHARRAAWLVGCVAIQSIVL